MNISGIGDKGSALKMSPENVRKWLAGLEFYHLPMGNPLEDMDPDNLPIDKDDGLVLLDFCWTGESSGSSYRNGTLAAFLADTEGYGDYVLFWNDGEEIEWLQVLDGKGRIFPIEIVQKPNPLQPEGEPLTEGKGYAP